MNTLIDTNFNLRNLLEVRSENVNTVEVLHLAKRFGAKQAVADVSFAVVPGEIFGLLGPNGAGKTTTIRMMLDIFQPDAGSVQLFGGKLDLAKKRRIGYMPEERGLYKDEKLESTLVYLATLKGMHEKTARTRLGGWLERLGLAEHRNKKIHELSKGMQQKAQIIATLLHEPQLIIMDEPFSGLDPVNTRLVKEIFEEQRAAGRSILMSTHQMYQVEALCDRIVLIHNGCSVLYGPVEQIKHNFAGNAIALEGYGDFSDVPGVLEVRRRNGSWQMTLERGADPQDVFRNLAAREEVKIARFEVAEPSLDDIFVSVVGGESVVQGVNHA
jgi:ABC-2 type transport system ATP-binding protein